MSPSQIALKQQGKKPSCSHVGTVALDSAMGLKTSSPSPLAEGSWVHGGDRSIPITGRGPGRAPSPTWTLGQGPKKPSPEDSEAALVS